MRALAFSLDDDYNSEGYSFVHPLKHSKVPGYSTAQAIACPVGQSTCGANVVGGVFSLISLVSTS